LGANPLDVRGLRRKSVDVVATCGSGLSRNHRLGEELAKGRKVRPTSRPPMPGVAEGAYTVDAALALARRYYDVEMPIAQEVHNALFEGKERPALPGRPAIAGVEDDLADFRRWVEHLTVGSLRAEEAGRGPV